MPALDHLQVFNAMHASPHARLELSAHLGDGLAAALWSNRDDARDYQAPSHHTLSCYIADGTGTFRRQRPADKGAGKLCIMPAGHESNWVVNGAIRLAHLYFSEAQFALGCVRLLDREPREMQLREATFLDDPQQAARFRQLIQLDWDEPGERLLASSLAHEIIDHALLTRSGLRQGLRLKGGLAPHQRRQLVEYIDSHLDQPISWVSWRCAATCPNTTLRGCSARASVAAASVPAGAAPAPGRELLRWGNCRWARLRCCAGLPVPAISATGSGRRLGRRRGISAAFLR
jgi:AraC family transcriptional regulator